MKCFFTTRELFLLLLQNSVHQLQALFYYTVACQGNFSCNSMDMGIFRALSLMVLIIAE